MNDNLNRLLDEYERKRLNAKKNALKRKNELYEKCPELKRIEDEITRLAISTNKQILQSDNKDLIHTLNVNIENLKLEKHNLLKKMHLSEDYLSPHYECSKCNDTGYITNDYRTVKCTCLKQRLIDLEYNKSNIANLKTQNFELFDSSIYSDEVNKEKYHSEKSPRENIENVKIKCIKFIENFDEPEEKGIILTGKPGVGKTFLSSCIANELLSRGKTVLYQTAPVMLDSVIDYKFGKTDNNILEEILNVDLLIIDDLGTEFLNSIKCSELFNIINTRLISYNNKITKTIISTNLDLQNLLNHYDERLSSRFIGNFNKYYVFGDDLRLRKKNK